MILNHEQIRAASILSDEDPQSYTNSSYNLTIGSIINEKGQLIEEYRIPPQGIILAVSKEKFNMPKDIVGYTTVRNKLSISGILAINIGIVDCHYKGPISSVLINFGKDDFFIKKGQSFMRMTFHKIEAMQADIPLNRANTFYDERHYIEERQKDARLLGNKFLYLDKEIADFKTKTVKGISIYFTKLGALVVLVIGVLSFVYSIFVGHDDSVAVKKFQSETFIVNKLKQEDSLINQLKTSILQIEKQKQTTNPGNDAH